MQHEISNSYKTARQESEKFQEDNDCSVVSLSIAAGVSYSEAHESLRLSGRRSRRGASIDVIEAAARRLGLTLKKYDRNSSLLRQVRTIQTAEYRLSSSEIWLIVTCNQILCMKDGKVHDWTAGRRNRPVRIYRVETSGPREIDTNLKTQKELF